MRRLRMPHAGVSRLRVLLSRYVFGEFPQAVVCGGTEALCMARIDTVCVGGAVEKCMTSEEVSHRCTFFRHKNPPFIALYTGKTI